MEVKGTSGLEKQSVGQTWNLARGEREDQIETNCKVISFPRFQLSTSVRNAACKLRENLWKARIRVYREIKMFDVATESGVALVGSKSFGECGSR